MKQPFDHKWKTPDTKTAVGKYNVPLVTPVHRALSVLKLPISAASAFQRFVAYFYGFAHRVIFLSVKLSTQFEWRKGFVENVT